MPVELIILGLLGIINSYKIINIECQFFDFWIIYLFEKKSKTFLKNGPPTPSPRFIFSLDIALGADIII